MAPRLPVSARATSRRSVTPTPSSVLAHSGTSGPASPEEDEPLSDDLILSAADNAAPALAEAFAPAPQPQAFDDGDAPSDPAGDTPPPSFGALDHPGANSTRRRMPSSDSASIAPPPKRAKGKEKAAAPPSSPDGDSPHALPHSLPQRARVHFAHPIGRSDAPTSSISGTRIIHEGAPPSPQGGSSVRLPASRESSPAPASAPGITFWDSLSNATREQFISMVSDQASRTSMLANARAPSARSPLPRGSRAAMPRAPAPSAAAAHSTSTSAPVPRALPTAGRLLSGLTLPDHPLAIAAIQAGWTKHIPLTLLTNDTLRGLKWSKSTDRTTATVSDSGVLTLLPSTWTAEGEHALTLPEWMQAFPRLIRLIRLYFPEEPDSGLAACWAQIWQDHYDGIRLHPDVYKRGRWQLFLAYDIECRRIHAAGVEDFDPSTFQDRVWNRIVTDFNLDHSVERATSSSTSGTSSFRASSSRPSRAASTATPATSAVAGSSSQRCIFCLATGCRNRACGITDTGYISLRAGKWSTTANELVCFAFNGAAGCARQPCRFLHRCTKCGASHSAQACA
ncbi:hypothetical protein CONPUDRAFT_170441 [Coniophora puteana RWD-64-598 SS2]|uniref:Uncharacterized protein n=1 Tax=Coniophora puteana (strain RWD-64-598) TaxID=741705 RepID=R7SD26_CONPW|nr:uncharacterized protein CONPUDRAFT_170441 [Coniophora puteana RWD-64-598 SS2]EIW73740.1 hypothetical protein CONPUDRAFT_170441 [Coniophora puteana RWD-64-598 SS2]